MTRKKEIDWRRERVRERESERVREIEAAGVEGCLSGTDLSSTVSSTNG